MKVEDFVENSVIPMNFDDKIYQYGERRTDNSVEYG